MAKRNITKKGDDVEQLRSYVSLLEEHCKSNTSLVHASNILKKSNDCLKEGKSSSRIQKLLILIPEYLKYLKGQDSIGFNIEKCSTDSFCNKKKAVIDSDIEKRV